MAAAVGNLGLQASVSKVINDTLNSFALEQNIGCYLDAAQKFDAFLQSSKIEVGGNFVVDQKAQLLVGCLQNQANKSELFNTLEATLSENISRELNRSLVEVGSASVQVSNSEVQNIVKNFIDVAQNSTCAASIRQDFNIVLEENSVLRVGLCPPEQVASYERACIAALQANSNVAQQVCKNLDTCANKAGNFVLSQDALVEGDCQQFQDAFTAMVNDSTALVTKEMSDVVKNPFSLEMIIIAAVALGVLLIVGAIVFFIIKAQANKKQTAQYSSSSEMQPLLQQGYPVQQGMPVGQQASFGSPFDSYSGGMYQSVR